MNSKLLNIKSNLQSPLLLVSKSPRRKELLETAGYHFDSFTLETSEIIDKNLNPSDQSAALSCIKMKHFLEKVGLVYQNFRFALTCDTLVEFKNRTLGKPKSIEEARQWLIQYSKKKQKVHTGCTLLKLDGSGETKTWVTTTELFFKEYSFKEVDHYIEKEPDILSKAGGYGIQDREFFLVQSIKGSFTNVVGLPLESLDRELKLWKI